MHIIIEYSWFWILACVLLGFAYASVMYAFDKSSVLSKKIKIFLFATRSISIFLISFLLLSPIIKRTINKEEKPIVVVVQDNSKSLVLTSDSSFYKSTYPQKLQNLESELQKDYDVKLYSFGQSLKNGFDKSFSEKRTDISLVFSEIQKRYKGRNLGALILASDGIYNTGNLPTSNFLSYPVFTIALGDTTTHCDASIKNLNYTKIAYLGNKFPLEISLKATKLSGTTRRLSVEKDEKTIFTKNISYTSNDFFTTETLLLDADKVGTQRYKISIDPCEKEISTKNNTQYINVEIIDNTRKIAIIAQSPHPDVGVLKRTLENSENYKVETFLANDFAESPQKYDLIVLHQLPSKNPKHNSLVNSILKIQTPVLFVLGAQTNLPQFNTLKMGLSINQTSQQTDEATPLYNEHFSNFTIPNEVSKNIEKFSPLIVPFGNYNLSQNTQTLLFAKIGNTPTNNPLLTFSQKQGTRYGFIIGDGFWQWNIVDFQLNNSHENVNTLLDKIVMYLSLQLNNEHFRINTKNIFSDNEPVLFEAELYNDNYEPTTSPDVKLILKNEKNKTSEYLFSKSANIYHLSIGNLPKGTYQYSIQTALNEKKYSKNGTFIVEESYLEELNLTADHTLLNTISQTSGGQMLSVNEVDKIPQLLKNNDNIKNTIYTQHRYTELINLPWCFIAIILLLGVEWIVRKYNGLF